MFDEFWWQMCSFICYSEWAVTITTMTCWHNKSNIIFLLSTYETDLRVCFVIKIIHLFDVYKTPLFFFVWNKSLKPVEISVGSIFKNLLLKLNLSDICCMFPKILLILQTTLDLHNSSLSVLFLGYSDFLLFPWFQSA